MGLKEIWSEGTDRIPLIQETVIDFCEHVNVSSDSTRWGALLDYF
jgi:hypothetical protein